MRIQYPFWRVDLWTLGLVVFTAYMASHAQSVDVPPAALTAPAVMRQAKVGLAVGHEFEAHGDSVSSIGRAPLRVAVKQ